MEGQGSDKGRVVADQPPNRDLAGPDDRTVIQNSEGGEEATPSRPQYKPPYVVVVEGPRTGARFPLGDGPNVIGRSPGSAIHLEDQSVSRQHAKVERETSGWTVADLGSKNGTLVNGKPIAEKVIIGHKDVVKAGIYQLRLITQPVGLEEEMTLPPELAMADRTVFVDTAGEEGETAGMEEARVPPGWEGPPAEGEPEGPEEPASFINRLRMLPRRMPKYLPKPVPRRLMILGGILGLVVIVAVAYFANRLLFRPPKPAKPKPAVARPEVMPRPKVLQPVEEAEGPATPEGPQPKPVAGPPEPVVQPVPVFLDFASSPMPAKVTFQDKDLGTTPLRVNVELEPDKAFQAKALFVMPEIKERFTQEVDFTVEKGTSVIPILFRGPIGIIKVNDLPRDVEFYLEGKFAYDRFQAQSAKLNEVVLQKPIYVPYGEYTLELRRARKLGETSPTYIADIIFRRDFIIAEDSPAYELEVEDSDLGTFPVRIKSDPANAQVFIDGKKVGSTPYDGTFPLGEHRLVLRKEGYFEHAEDLKVDINTPFVADVKLKTSIAGAHINNARLAMRREMYQDAINELAEGLNSNPAQGEIALANYLLGVSYLNLNDIQRAMGYFEQARKDEEQRYPAMLGLVSGYAMMDMMDRALPLLVEVLLNAQGEDVKKEANDLFQRISPFRSVIYVYSEPAGARIVVNGNPVAQSTPVILHELPLGNYRIRIEKAGYLPTDLNITLSVNEFNPVIVKLKPIPR